MKNKLIKVTQTVFAYGIGLMMAAALLIGLCYIAAFIIGCPGSEAIHAFLSAHVLPYMYIAGIVISIFGIINMYLRGEHVFMLELVDKRSHK